MSRSKGWCFTSYNVACEPFAANKHKVKYLVYGRETCPKTGRLHLQGTVVFKTRTKLSTCVNYLPGAHFEVLRGTLAQSIDYCKKDGDFTEFGELPDAASTDNKFKRILTLAAAGDITAIKEDYPGDFLRYKKSIESSILYNNVELDDSCGYWIVGPPRCGKDYAVRKFGNYYSKPLNKWWDGYTNEENVLISDCEPTHGCWLGYFLKIWMDRYAFTAEIKGASIKIRPKKIFVTSNFHIEECFAPKIAEAIKARCVVITVYDEAVSITPRLPTAVPDRVFKALENLPEFSRPVDTVDAVAAVAGPSGLQEHDGFSSEMEKEARRTTTSEDSEDDFWISPAQRQKAKIYARKIKSG